MMASWISARRPRHRRPLEAEGDVDDDADHDRPAQDRLTLERRRPGHRRCCCGPTGNLAAGKFSRSALPDRLAKSAWLHPWTARAAPVPARGTLSSAECLIPSGSPYTRASRGRECPRYPGGAGRVIAELACVPPAKSLRSPCRAPASRLCRTGRISDRDDDGRPLDGHVVDFALEEAGTTHPLEATVYSPSRRPARINNREHADSGATSGSPPTAHGPGAEVSTRSRYDRVRFESEIVMNTRL